jgi:hypothetical protein
MKDTAHDVIACLWCNSTFGLLSYWWSANKAQDGRGSVTTSQMPKFSILDPRKLSTAQLKKANAFFDTFKTKPFLPAHKVDEDAALAELDAFVVTELLGCSTLNELANTMAIFRKKLAHEPSFNGGK